LMFEYWNIPYCIPLQCNST